MAQNGAGRDVPPVNLAAAGRNRQEIQKYREKNWLKPVENSPSQRRCEFRQT